MQESKTAILIPTYGRADRLSSVVNDIRQNTPEPHAVYFIIEKEDILSFNVCIKNGFKYIFNKYTPSYAGAINTGFEQTHEPYFFLGSDDLHFHKGWLTKCFEKMQNPIRVVGTNDLLNRDVLSSKTSTHSLVSRQYINEQGGTVDNSYPVLYEYKHNYTDWEFIQTARHRGVFTPCLDAVVEHMHPGAKKGPIDETYIKNQATLKEDRATFESRKHLWGEK